MVLSKKFRHCYTCESRFSSFAADIRTDKIKDQSFHTFNDWNLHNVRLKCDQIFKNSFQNVAKAFIRIRISILLSVWWLSVHILKDCTDWTQDDLKSLVFSEREKSRCIVSNEYKLLSYLPEGVANSWRLPSLQAGNHRIRANISSSCLFNLERKFRLLRLKKLDDAAVLALYLQRLVS